VTFVAAVTIGGLLGPAGMLPVAQSAEPPAVPMECQVYETKKASITVGFKAGNFLFSVGPEVTYSQQTGVAWDRAVHELIARFVELCTRYNAGLVTKEEYEVRLGEIEALYREARALERRLMEETRARAQATLDKMDRIMSGQASQERQGPDPLVDSLDELNRRIDKLEPIGRPLIPKPPCPPPDMLGAPGRSC